MFNHAYNDTFEYLGTIIKMIFCFHVLKLLSDLCNKIMNDLCLNQLKDFLRYLLQANYSATAVELSSEDKKQYEEKKCPDR